MFEKTEVSKLLSSISAFGKKQKEVQAMLTNIIAQVVYQSIAHSNADPGIKLYAAMLENKYNRTNGVITYLCKMGNFKHNKADGLTFKATYPRTEEMAVEMAEKCISNPMFTIVKEQAIKKDAIIVDMFKMIVTKARNTVREGKNVISHNEQEEKLFAQIEDYVTSLA